MGTIIICIYLPGDLGIRKLSNISKVTQPVRDRDGS